MEHTPVQRAIFYVDGYNLFYGLRDYRDQSNPNYYWLNLQTLAEHVMTSVPGVQYALVSIKYFTAMVDYNPKKAARQSAYIKAISTLDKLVIIRGTFLMKDVKCRSCHTKYRIPGEKKTDVNIAVNLLKDAVQDCYDTAFVISGDTDLIPAIEAVRDLTPSKSVIAVFPPNRAHETIKQTATDWRKIGRKWLEKSQFPLVVRDKDTNRIQCPVEWRNGP